MIVMLIPLAIYRLHNGRWVGINMSFQAYIYAISDEACIEAGRIKSTFIGNIKKLLKFPIPCYQREPSLWKIHLFITTKFGLIYLNNTVTIAFIYFIQGNPTSSKSKGMRLFSKTRSIRLPPYAVNCVYINCRLRDSMLRRQTCFRLRNYESCAERSSRWDPVGASASLKAFTHQPAKSRTLCRHLDVHNEKEEEQIVRAEL